MAKKTGARKHIHKYFRNPTNGLWTCGSPDCSHFVPLNVGEPLGKQSLCWSCGESFILDENNMNEHQPHCLACKGVDTKGLADFLNNRGV